MKKTDSEKISAKLKTLEEEIDRLIYEYDQFFLGFLKVEPQRRRKQVEKMIRELMDTYIANATLKFRLTNLRNKYATYREKWNRFLRQMEEGTFVRDIFRAKQRGLISEIEAKRKLSQDSVSRMKLAEEAAKKSTEQPSDDRYLSLYNEYVKIKGKTNMSYEKWKNKLEEQKKKLIKKTKAKDIEFKIIEENGKLKIKAIPKK